MDETVENVFVFIADSVRWDYGRDLFGVQGATPVKTVAHSTFTFSSIPSMLLGVVPHRHGVYSPRHRSQYKPNKKVLDLDGYNSYLNLERGQRILKEGVFPEVDTGTIKSIEPPFVCVEHDMGGHAPYNSGYDSAAAFFKEAATTKAELETYYENAVRNSVDRFLEKQNTLDERGLLDSTLVILTSDHGELLYDYGGLTAHVRPVTPELVYVPTAVIYPGLDQSKLPDYVQHVDLVPSILDALGETAPITLDGDSFFDDEYAPRPGVSITRFFPRFLTRFGNQCIYEQESVWDLSGGRVFNRKRLPTRLLAFAADGLLTRKFSGGKWNGYHPRSLLRNGRLYLRAEQTFGNPGFDSEVARNLVDFDETTNEQTRALNDDTEQTLQELGYI